MKSDVPTFPVLFLKPPSAILPSGGSVLIPSISRDLHHEVEMTVLLGRGGKRISRHDALSCVAGYGVGLDMTLRDVQAAAKSQGLPWAVAKGFDTSAPLSEFVPASDIRDPHDLRLELRVNGTIRQTGSTRNFLFPLDELISLISGIFTLGAGDVIFTGTPEGVAQVVPGDQLAATLSEADSGPIARLSVRVENDR